MRRVELLNLLYLAVLSRTITMQLALSIMKVTNFIANVDGTVVVYCFTNDN